MQGSPNFAYLAHHDPRLVALGTQAEEHFASDPATCLAKLRLFAELLAKRAAAKVGLLPYPGETQQTLVDRLFEKNVIGAVQRSLLHEIRRVGNAAVHEGRGDASESLHQLRMARELAVWFQRTYGNNRVDWACWKRLNGKRARIRGTFRYSTDPLRHSLGSVGNISAMVVEEES